MGERSRDQYRRLVGWYPKPWRERWEAVVLGTLEDDIDHRGTAGPSAREAWSFRAHGAAERLAHSPVGTAFAALIAGVLGAASLFVIDTVPQAVAPLGVLSAVVSPLLAALASIGLAYRGGLLGIRAVYACLGLATVALLCRYGAQTAWSIGFDAADAGAPEPLLAHLFAPLVAAGWATGSAAFVPLLATVAAESARPARFVVAVVLGAMSALVLGAVLVVPMTSPLAAAAVLVSAIHLGAKRQPAPSPRSATASASISSPGWPRRITVLLASATALAGGTAVTFAFTGSNWPGFSGDGTAAMNAGLAIAALAAIPLVAAAGDLLRTRSRYRRSPAPATLTGSLIFSSASQAVGAASPIQWLLILAAAALTGATAAALLAPLFPVPSALRAGILVLIAATASVTLGITIAVLCPVLAPIAAAALLAALAVRRSKEKRSDAQSAVST